MRMSASYQKPKPSHKVSSISRGFTLLEVLVVLVLVGMLTAFSLPQFSILRDRLTFNLNRESFERELDGLSYVAFKEGSAVVLSGEYPRRPAENTTTAEENVSIAAPDFSEPGQLRTVKPVAYLDAALNLPETWVLSVDEPIVYQPSGFCTGGTVNLAIGGQLYIYGLKAPTCQAQLK